MENSYYEAFMGKNTEKTKNEPFFKQGWFKQAVILGIIGLAGNIGINFFFGLYAVETKGFISSLIGDAFFRWGAGLASFALASDLFFHFVLRRQ